MVVLRRFLLRYLKIRNLLALTLVIVLLYMVKVFSNLGAIESQDVQKGMWHSQDRISDFSPIGMKRMDWHNYTQIGLERIREGIGEHGKPAHLSKVDSSVEKSLYAVNGFNAALSDEIALNRSLPDIRHPACKRKKYLESLPTVSVVVPFHNEHWSTLLRTAYSVLNRSPVHLLKEIFLVDDASTKEFLKKDLDEYVAKFLPKVEVVRLANRSGLIAARLAGARRATADVLLFLDSHVEPTVNWLPPLLEPIALNYRVVMCPFIDVIAYDTFEYRAQDEGARGAFDWELFYKRLPVLPKDKNLMPEPFESPIMAGGLFAISRKYFRELGGYDPGLDIWGGEQYELSFKIWQCGGRLLDAPCSRVGHIYRKFAPFPNPGHGDFVGRNYRRVAEVWMDEYAQYLYKRRPHYLKIDTGDISEQKALREKLNCKSFKWFINKIAFDLTHKYPPVEPEAYAEGRIRPLADINLCVDAQMNSQMAPVVLKPCSKRSGAEQGFVFSWHRDIKSNKRNMCWDLPDSTPKSKVVLYSCHLGGGNQLWRYHHDTKQISHGSGNTCLDFDRTSRSLYVSHCSLAEETQQWTVDKVNEEMLSHWDIARDSPTGPPLDYE